MRSVLESRMTGQYITSTNYTRKRKAEMCARTTGLLRNSDVKLRRPSEPSVASTKPGLRLNLSLMGKTSLRL